MYKDNNKARQADECMNLAVTGSLIEFARHKGMRNYQTRLMDNQKFDFIGLFEMYGKSLVRFEQFMKDVVGIDVKLSFRLGNMKNVNEYGNIRWEDEDNGVKKTMISSIPYYIIRDDLQRELEDLNKDDLLYWDKLRKNYD